MEVKDRIFVAIDISNPFMAKEIVENLIHYIGGVKVGLEFFTSTYAQIVTGGSLSLIQALKDFYSLTSGKLFWDGKWDDIPNTVAGAAKGIQPILPKFVNVHASAGINAVISAVNNSKSIVLGVTVLTSIDEEECVSIFGDKPNKKVLYFARQLIKAKAGGLVCSPKELVYLKENLLPEEFVSIKKVIPGIRPIWAQSNDQKRTMTPSEAVSVGADYLVIGRPIMDPPDNIGTPVEAVQKIIEEITAIS